MSDFGRREVLEAVTEWALAKGKDPRFVGKGGSCRLYRWSLPQGSVAACTHDKVTASSWPAHVEEVHKLTLTHVSDACYGAMQQEGWSQQQQSLTAMLDSDWERLMAVGASLAKLAHQLQTQGRCSLCDLSDSTPLSPQAARHHLLHDHMATCMHLGQLVVDQCKAAPPQSYAPPTFCCPQSGCGRTAAASHAACRSKIAALPKLNPCSAGPMAWHAMQFHIVQHHLNKLVSFATKGAATTTSTTTSKLPSPSNKLASPSTATAAAAAATAHLLPAAAAPFIITAGAQATSFSTLPRTQPQPEAAPPSNRPGSLQVPGGSILDGLAHVSTPRGPALDGLVHVSTPAGGPVDSPGTWLRGSMTRRPADNKLWEVQDSLLPDSQEVDAWLQRVEVGMWGGAASVAASGASGTSLTQRLSSRISHRSSMTSFLMPGLQHSLGPDAGLPTDDEVDVWLARYGVAHTPHSPAHSRGGLPQTPRSGGMPLTVVSGGEGGGEDALLSPAAGVHTPNAACRAGSMVLSPAGVLHSRGSMTGGQGGTAAAHPATYHSEVLPRKVAQPWYEELLQSFPSDTLLDSAHLLPTQLQLQSFPSDTLLDSAHLLPTQLQLQSFPSDTLDGAHLLPIQLQLQSLPSGTLDGAHLLPIQLQLQSLPSGTLDSAQQLPLQNGTATAPPSVQLPHGSMPYSLTDASADPAEPATQSAEQGYAGSQPQAMATLIRGSVDDASLFGTNPAAPGMDPRTIPLANQVAMQDQVLPAHQTLTSGTSGATRTSASQLLLGRVTSGTGAITAIGTRGTSGTGATIARSSRGTSGTGAAASGSRRTSGTGAAARAGNSGRGSSNGATGGVSASAGTRAGGGGGLTTSSQLMVEVAEETNQVAAAVLAASQQVDERWSAAAELLERRRMRRTVSLTSDNLPSSATPAPAMEVTSLPPGGATALAPRTPVSTAPAVTAPAGTTALLPPLLMAAADAGAAAYSAQGNNTPTPPPLKLGEAANPASTADVHNVRLLDLPRTHSAAPDPCLPTTQSPPPTTSTPTQSPSPNTTTTTPTRPRLPSSDGRMLGLEQAVRNTLAALQSGLQGGEDVSLLAAAAEELAIAAGAAAFAARCGSPVLPLLQAELPLLGGAGAAGAASSPTGRSPGSRGPLSPLSPGGGSRAQQAAADLELPATPEGREASSLSVVKPL